MAIRVALHHETVYAFTRRYGSSSTRAVPLPRATPTAPLPGVTPERHFVNWQ
jgi:hypothetical protein